MRFEPKYGRGWPHPSQLTSALSPSSPTQASLASNPGMGFLHENGRWKVPCLLNMRCCKWAWNSPNLVWLSILLSHLPLDDVLCLDILIPLGRCQSQVSNPVLASWKREDILGPPQAQRIVQKI